MQATLPVSDIRKVLPLLGKCILRKNTVPILSFVLMEISAGKLVIRATDLDKEIAIDFEAETEGKGKVALSFAALSGFVCGAAGQMTIRHLTDDKGRPCVEMTADEGFRMRVNSILPPEDYPYMLTDMGDATRWSMAQREAHRMLRLARWCISTEETRYYLNGIYLTKKPDGDTLRAVATDGHRLACIDTDVSDIDAVSIIVSTEAVELLLAMVQKDANEPVAFTVSSQRAKMVVNLDGIVLVAKTVDGTFPDYTRVLPSGDPNYRISVSRAGIARLYRAAKAMSPHMSLAARLDPKSKTMSIRQYDGDEVAAPLQIEASEGREDSIGFNAKYLSDLTRTVPVATLETVGPGDPATVRGEDPNAFWVLMPMRV